MEINNDEQYQIINICNSLCLIGSDNVIGTGFIKLINVCWYGCKVDKHIHQYIHCSWKKDKKILQIAVLFFDINVKIISTKLSKSWPSKGGAFLKFFFPMRLGPCFHQIIEAKKKGKNKDNKGKKVWKIEDLNSKSSPTSRVLASKS